MVPILIEQFTRMLVLLFGGAFGFFTAGFHLVAVLAGILLR